MAATVSPTPLPSSYGNLYRRPSARQMTRPAAPRPLLRRGSPLGNAPAVDLRPPVSRSRELSLGDSSDDDVPAPIKFSASVKALLGEDASGLDTSPMPSNEEKATSLETEENAKRNEVDSVPKLIERAKLNSPDSRDSGSPAPRVVRVGSGPRSTASSRAGHVGYHREEGQGSGARFAVHYDHKTPAPRTRSVRINGSRSHTRSPSTTSSGDRSHLGGDRSKLEIEEGAHAEHGHDTSADDKLAQLGPTTVMRPRPGEATDMQSSMRVKRVGKMTGSFLNGPARRGMIRRQSEEDQVPQQEAVGGAYAAADGSPWNGPQLESRDFAASPLPNDLVPEERNIQPVEDVAEEPGYVKPIAASTVFSTKKEVPSVERPRSPRPLGLKTRSTPASQASHPPAKSSSTRVQPVFKVPPLPALPLRHDQENDPPPTFKRTKPSGFALLDNTEKVSVLEDDKSLHVAVPATSTQRKPLAPRSENTPHRAAPPPPKMTLLQTATATAGAAAASSQAKKKRNHVTVNNKLFTRMDCIGRGGSSKVYRVMAENYKIFALKRVDLRDVDPLAMAGYKGEIDLLRKLEHVDRVVSLFDWEINDDKQTLSVLMEMGESDLYRILNLRLKAENAVFDISFTRHYWREMLECVLAVHDYDIVHSDLKPANFLLVQGRLKLIDFGIANAIQDNTVNVHREQQIGTPNYMSPEALIDSNAASGLPANAGKKMKLGKPSDVWSLGCILYQMVYGQPPFAHITNQYERILSIPNPKVAIPFPATSVGGLSVPLGLLKTLKRCLQRDQHLRPTVQQLLEAREPFLNPDAVLEGTIPMTQEMLGRVLGNVVRHCRTAREHEANTSIPQNDKTQMPSDEELEKWPALFFNKIKQALEDGTA